MRTHPLVRHFVRAYTWRELPGWGIVYRHLVGDYRSNYRWQNSYKGWVRGKGHDFEMLLDLSSWSNRFTYYTGRYADTGNQILVRALLNPGDTFVDIGANEGMIALEAAQRVGKSGKVIAFEPNPGPADIFAAAIQRNGLTQIELRRVGLSEEAATLALHIPAINTGEGSFARINSKRDVATVTTQVVVGDQALEGVHPALIKIDVEGFELRVIRGLHNLLRRTHPPISIEYNPEALMAAGTTPRELHDHLVGFGYIGFTTSTQGRGRKQRLTLGPIELAAQDMFDALYLHGSCTELQAKLAVTGPY